MRTQLVSMCFFAKQRRGYNENCGAGWLSTQWDGRESALRRRSKAAKVRRVLQRARQARSQLKTWTNRHKKGVWGVVSRAISRCQNPHLQILAPKQLQDLLQMGEQMATMCTPTAKLQRPLAVALSGCLSTCKKPWQRRGTGTTAYRRAGLMINITIVIVWKLPGAPFAMSLAFEGACCGN